jgi:hypothetical protein
MQINGENNEEETFVCGVYSLQGVKNKNAVKINHLENIKLKKDERIQDTLLNEYNISPFVNGEVFACNITNHYLVSTKKLPMLYINIRWNKYKMVKPILYKLFLYFTIESEVKSSKDLLENRLYGKFTLDVLIDNMNRELENTVDKFPGNEQMIKILEDFTNTEEMKEIINGLIEREEKKREEMFKAEFEEYKSIPKPTISLDDYLE